MKIKSLLGLALISTAIYMVGCSGSGNKPTEGDTTSTVSADSVSQKTTDGFDVATTDSVAASKISAYLLRYLDKNLKFMDSTDRKYTFYKIDLNSDENPEYIVSMQGSSFCGSGGCTFMIFSSDVQLINNITVMRAPVYRSANVTNGWNDLIIEGSSAGTYRHMTFDSKTRTYPKNASMVQENKTAPAATDIKMWDLEKSKAKTFTF